MDTVIYVAAAFSLGLGTNLALRHVFKKQHEDSLVKGYLAITNKANALLEKQKANKSDIDPVTGRIARKKAIKRINAAIKSAHDEDEIASVAILNPVDFHKVNEAYGYESGDKIILTLYKRLKKYLAQQEETKGFSSVAVTEAANFLIWMPVGMEHNDVMYHLNAMGEIIKEPIELDDKTINVMANIGCVVVPEEIDTGEDVYLTLEKITKAGYTPKHISTVDDVKGDSPHKSAIIEDMIAKALEEDTIEAHLQPIVNTTNRSMQAAEVLARMRSGDEMISPGVFIPVAERTGLIDQIATRVIEKSFDVLKSMSDCGRLQEHFYLSINLTTRQIGNAEFMDSLIELAKEHAIPHRHIQWEITETVFTDNDEMFKVINSLVELGFRVAMDDFGTGYSSLKQLSRLKATALKVDRSFVIDINRNEKNMKLVKAIHGIAKSLGMHVVVEGVENEKELASLQSVGLDIFQGFYFFKPMPSEKFVSLIRQSV